MAIEGVKLTPQGHVILAKFVDDGGYVDALLMTGGHQPYVIARNYDASDGTWGGGSYFNNLHSAYDAWQETYGGR